MTLNCMQNAQQAKNRWPSPLLPAIFAAVSLIAIVDSASLAAAAECQVTDLRDGGTIQSMPTWKGTTLSIQPLTITVERDIYWGLVPSPVLEVAPYMENSRILLGETQDQGMATIGACLSPDNRKTALFNHAMFRSTVKSPAKAHMQFMKVPALRYNGKRQVTTIRTTPPETRTSARYKTDTLIGPVQEIQKPIRPDERSVSQAVAALPSAVESPSPFGGQPFVAWNPYQSGLQLPNSEPYRMNMTTIAEFHDGNCPSGCP